MINFTVLRGNLTRDPELRYSPSGSAFCKFSIALNSKYVSNGEEKEEVSYIEVTTFGKQAEACAENLKKGSDVFLEGRLKQERWKADDGTGRSKVVVMAKYVNWLSGKKSGAGSSGGDEDIPF